MVDRVIGFWFAPGDRNQYTALRVLYAFASLVHLAALWPWREQFFSSRGMLSAPDSGPSPLPSLFGHSPPETFVTIAFVAVTFAFVGLLVGFWPRVCALIGAYWHYSLNFDLAPAASSYDVILRLVGYVIALSPLGDALWRLGEPRDDEPPVYGLYLLRWQLLCIYVSTVWLKVADSYWRNGQLMSYFMMSVYSRTHSAWWAHAEVLSAIMTYSTILMEISIPFLLFSKRWRFLGFLTGLLLHGGIAVTSTLGIFSLCMGMMYPAFISTNDVRAWMAWLRQRIPSHAA